MYEELNPTELAVAKALGKLRQGTDLTYNRVEALLLLELARSNHGFDFDMFRVKVAQAEEER